MDLLLRCLMATNTDGMRASFGLLLFRIAVCAGLLTHGLQKWQSFETLSKTFPDPIHTGPYIALCLVLLAEVICAAPIILGLFTRLAVIPPIIMMLIAVFIHHDNDPFSAKELALAYLSGYSLLLFLGPGCFSLDGLIYWFFTKPKSLADV